MATTLVISMGSLGSTGLHLPSSKIENNILLATMVLTPGPLTELFRSLATSPLYWHLQSTRGTVVSGSTNLVLGRAREEYREAYHDAYSPPKWKSNSSSGLKNSSTRAPLISSNSHQLAQGLA